MNNNDQASPVKKVTIRNYKPVEALSEETTAFTAAIYLDGQRAGEASNAGHGGANRYQFADREQHQAFLAYAEPWAQTNGVTGCVTDTLIDKLCDDYALRNEARALLQLRTNTVILIEKQPVWFTDDHSGPPAHHQHRQLLLVPDGADPAELAAEQNADAWRVIPID